MEGIRNARPDPISTKHVQIISIPNKTENDEICADGAPSVSKNARLLNTIDVLSTQTKRGINVALRELFDTKIVKHIDWLPRPFRKEARPVSLRKLQLDESKQYRSWGRRDTEICTRARKAHRFEQEKILFGIEVLHFETRLDQDHFKNWYWMPPIDIFQIQNFQRTLFTD